MYEMIYYQIFGLFISIKLAFISVWLILGWFRRNRLYLIIILRNSVLESFPLPLENQAITNVISIITISYSKHTTPVPKRIFSYKLKNQYQISVNGKIPRERPVTAIPTSPTQFSKREMILVQSICVEKFSPRGRV